MEKCKISYFASLGFLSYRQPSEELWWLTLALTVVRLQKGLVNQGWEMEIYSANSDYHTLTLGKFKHMVCLFSWLIEAQIPLFKWSSKYEWIIKLESYVVNYVGYLKEDVLNI